MKSGNKAKSSSKSNEFPALTTTTLVLVQLQNEHAEDIFKIFSDKKVTSYYNLHPFKYLEQAHEFIDWHFLNWLTKSGLWWGIKTKTKPEIIGAIGFNHFSSSRLSSNIGYALRSDCWNKGYMSAAILAILNYGFNELNLDRIEAEVMLENIASERALEKAGFIKKTVLKERLYWNDMLHDMSLFAKHKRDFDYKRSLSELSRRKRVKNKTNEQASADTMERFGVKFKNIGVPCYPGLMQNKDNKGSNIALI